MSHEELGSLARYLDVICMARTIDMAVVPSQGRVLDMCSIDRDAAFLLLGRIVNVFVLLHLG